MSPQPLPPWNPTEGGPLTRLSANGPHHSALPGEGPVPPVAKRRRAWQQPAAPRLHEHRPSEPRAKVPQRAAVASRRGGKAAPSRRGGGERATPQKRREGSGLPPLDAPRRHARGARAAARLPPRGAGRSRWLHPARPQRERPPRPPNTSPRPMARAVRSFTWPGASRVIGRRRRGGLETRP